MTGLVPVIHVVVEGGRRSVGTRSAELAAPVDHRTAWMTGTSPVMTGGAEIPSFFLYEKAKLR